MTNKLTRRFFENTYDEHTMYTINQLPLEELKRKRTEGETLAQDERRIYELYNYWLCNIAINDESRKLLIDYCLLHSDTPTPTPADALDNLDKEHEFLQSVDLEPLRQLKKRHNTRDAHKLTPEERELVKLYDYYLYASPLTDDELAALRSYCAAQGSPVPDESVVTNESGGSQSYTGTRYDLLPATALDSIAQVLYSGAIKYGADNWKLIPAHDHINHSIRHLIRFGLTGDTEDLSHAACRAIFALNTHLEGVQSK